MEGASTQLEDLRVCLREDVRDALLEEGKNQCIKLNHKIIINVLLSFVI
jgi:hypothetical protein